ncbi:MAG: hypothetical protein J7647_09375 [Cyanobacteria bacterium SBLK]|nr:hypothetical protein [Cyanobacteria bacterium SBLK]
MNLVLTAFKLKPELVSWTKEEDKAIYQYHYAIQILIECKEAAANVSGETWAAIEERMFRAPDRLAQLPKPH